MGVQGKFPTDKELRYVPLTKENQSITSCSIPVSLDLSKELASKKVIITAAPGAFTPACTEQHIPAYLKSLKDFKSKGVDRVIILTANDAFVLSAWAKALGYSDESNYAIFASDENGALSKELGSDYNIDMSKMGLGTRTSRYVAVVDDGKIIYVANESGGDFNDPLKPETVLKHL